jgi:hypothetical protein
MLFSPFIFVALVVGVTPQAVDWGATCTYTGEIQHADVSVGVSEVQVGYMAQMCVCI